MENASGGAPRLTVHVEVVWFDPSFHARAADANGDISFDDNTPFATIIAGIQKLDMQQVLYEAMIGDFRVCFALRRTKLFDHFGAICGIFAPLMEVGRVETVSEVAESGIWAKPFGIVPVESLVTIGRENGLLLLLEDGFQIGHVSMVYAFIIHLGQGIQFLTLLLEGDGGVRVVQGGELT